VSARFAAREHSTPPTAVAALIEGIRLVRSAIVVADIDRSTAFHRHFGFEERARTQVGSAAIIAVLGLPGEPSRLQLTQPLETPPRGGGGGGAYFVLEVADLDSAVASLGRASIEPETIPPPDDAHGARTAVFRDPDGFGIELIERVRPRPSPA
jgi:catechol 2,3-dioxygenase-like lactoylglutathione lyase family enzyme